MYGGRRMTHPANSTDSLEVFMLRTRIECNAAGSVMYSLCVGLKLSFVSLKRFVPEKTRES